MNRPNEVTTADPPSPSCFYFTSVARGCCSAAL